MPTLSPCLPTRALAPRLRRAVLAATLVLVPGLALPIAAQEGPKDFSAAERLLLMSPQLQGQRAGTRLSYRYHHGGSQEAGFDDQAAVLLAARPDGQCCAARGEFLSGERRLNLPEVEQAEGNPVVLYFLERDIREMNRLTKGATNYFRKRIRMALYEAATVRDVAASYQGRPVAAQEILLTPFLNDPNEARFPQHVQRRYRFVLSKAVPGQVLAMQAVTPGAQAGGAPLAEDLLTLDGATLPALQPYTPLAIRTTP